MREHELRRQVVTEMHLRRWPLLHIPSLVVQWVLIVPPEEREAEDAFLAPLPAPQGASPAHRSGQLAPGVWATWERHNEGSSLALFFSDLKEDQLTAGTLPEELVQHIKWAQQAPGEYVGASQLLLVQDDASAARLLPVLDFNRSEMISCNFSGGARVWGDFRIQEDGFVRLLVAANGVDQRDFTRSVQRLQELGNYRNKALMGLPAAHQAWPRLDKVGQQLAHLNSHIASEEAKDDTLMEELSILSLEASAIANSIDYRLSATAAYGQLVQERLSQLRVSKIAGYASLDGFTQRRFMPAIRTCAAVTERERNLSLRAERLASLLRARIDTRIENQNAELLRSMDKSSRLQLRLQQLVEGLSVVALSYYLLGLVGYFLKGAEHLWPALDKDLVLAALALPLVGAIWLTMRRLKTKLLGGKAGLA